MWSAAAATGDGRKEVVVDVAQGKRQLTNREVVGVLVGSKKAQNSFLSWMFSPNARSYKRKHTVWMCPNFSGEQGRSPRKGFGRGFLKFVAILFIIMPSLYLLDPSVGGEAPEDNTVILIIGIVAAIGYYVYSFRKFATRNGSSILDFWTWAFVLMYSFSALGALISNPLTSFKLLALVILILLAVLVFTSFKIRIQSDDKDAREGGEDK